MYVCARVHYGRPVEQYIRTFKIESCVKLSVAGLKDNDAAGFSVDLCVVCVTEPRPVTDVGRSIEIINH